MKASIDPKMKLNGKNKTTAINTWGVAAFRYGAAILQWKESELKDVGNPGKQWQCMKRYTRRAIIHKEKSVRKKSDECGTLR